MSATDPLSTVWEALERADCSPHGQAWNYRARCPHHNGDNREALHVQVGGDGRALIHCFAHDCRAEDVARALGLSIRDLFSPGHKHARRRRLQEARRIDFHGRAKTAANILCALDQLGVEWFIELRTDCPLCGSPAAVLFVSSWGIEYLSCPGDAEAEALGYAAGACTLDQARQALAARVEDRKRAA